MLASLQCSRIPPVLCHLRQSSTDALCSEELTIAVGRKSRTLVDERVNSSQGQEQLTLQGFVMFLGGVT
jgi:hypothetical protein